MKKRFYLLLLLIFITSFLLILSFSRAEAVDKTWGGGGDGTSWSDKDNWSPQEVPSESDDILIDKEEVSVICTETFKAKSITLGGRQASILTSNNFIFGTISPASSYDIAILNRQGGTFVFKGGGVVTVRGQYKDSNESLGLEPSFMFWLK